MVKGSRADRQPETRWVKRVKPLSCIRVTRRAHTHRKIPRNGFTPFTDARDADARASRAVPRKRGHRSKRSMASLKSASTTAETAGAKTKASMICSCVMP